MCRHNNNLCKNWPVIFALGCRKIDIDRGTSIHNLQMKGGRNIVNSVIFPGWLRINKRVYCLERERTQQRVEMISIGGLQLRVTSTHRRRADASQPSIRINEHHTISNSSKKGPEDAQSLVPPREVTVLALVHRSMQDCNGTLESRRGNRTNKTSRVCMSHRDLGGCNATRDRDPQFTSKDVKESSAASSPSWPPAHPQCQCQPY